MIALLEPLPHLRDTDVTTQEFEAILDMVGAFFASSHLTGMYMVQAGHRHFDVALHEALLHKVNRVAGVLRTRVAQRRQVCEKQAVAWQVASNGLAVPMAYNPLSTIDTTNTTILAGLAQIGSFFVRNNLTRILTVRLRRVDLPVGPRQALVETTNERERTQEIRVVPLTTVTRQQAATWWFNTKGQKFVMDYCFTAEENHNGQADEEDAKKGGRGK